MSRRNQSFGKRGEEAAAACAQQQGYELLETNSRTPFGEIDVILRSPEGEIVFMEVKTRSGTAYGDPEEAVSPAKLSHMERSAEFWLEAHYEKTPPCRMDVMAIRYTADKGSISEMKWYKDVG